jgi:hypothetical protein
VLAGSVASAVASSDSTGVMPDPAATAAYRRRRAGSNAVVKWPSGGRTSTVSPMRSALPANVEKAPPGICRTPIRNRPCAASSAGVEQMEYDRRTSSASGSARRSVTCWPAVKANASRSSGGTSKVTATASSVSRSISPTRSRWNRITGP